MMTVVAFLVAIGVLIVFHELGHYWAARACGVRVLRFSVGFGTPLLRKVSPNTGTEWVLAAIPLGGYVKMLDEREAPVPAHQLAEAFNRKPVGQRAFIVAAGPIANFILAVLFYTIVSIVPSLAVKPLLGEPTPNSIAEQSGVKGGETVLALSVGDSRYEVKSWQDIRWHSLRAGAFGEPMTLVLSGGAADEIKLDVAAIESGDLDDAWFQRLGLRMPDTDPIVSQVLPDSVAALAGLKVGDEIVRINQLKTQHAAQVIKTLRASGGQSVDVQLLREGKPVQISLTPRAETINGQTIGRIGAAIGAPMPTVRVERSVSEAVADGVQHTWQMSALTLRMLWKLATGQASIKQISGPITIADYAGKTASFGLIAYLSFLAVVSVSLGVLNLLPIPLLDGGHLLYYAAEVLRGRAIPQSWEVAGQRIGIVLLGALMVVALSNDLLRLFAR
jgi:regulator of sigma E protease